MNFKAEVCVECYVMLQKQTGFRGAIKGFKKREREKCVNSNREQVMLFFPLKFFTRFSSNVFVQGNHYFRGNAHAFFFFSLDGQFFLFSGFSILFLSVVNNSTQNPKSLEIFSV